MKDPCHQECATDAGHSEPCIHASCSDRLAKAISLLRRAMPHCHGNARRMREQFNNDHGDKLYAEAMQIVVDIQAFLGVGNTKNEEEADGEFDPKLIAQNIVNTFGHIKASEATREQQDLVTLAKAYLETVNESQS